MTTGSRGFIGELRTQLPPKERRILAEAAIGRLDDLASQANPKEGSYAERAQTLYNEYKDPVPDAHLASAMATAMT